MAQIKNQVIYTSDFDTLNRLADEYRFVGREVRVEPRKSRLVVLALPSTYKRKEEREKKLRKRKRDLYGDEET